VSLSVAVLGVTLLMTIFTANTGVAANSLPLTLKLWSLNDVKTVTCSGKAWVEIAPGKLQRDAIIALLDEGDSKTPGERLLACDDGAGNGAPITGSTAQVKLVHAGDTILQGTLRIIALDTPAKPGSISAIVFAVNTLAGDMALMSKSGKGMIRLDHATGIYVYPPSYKLKQVAENVIYEVEEAQPKPQAPCTISYLSDDPNASPKVIRSPLDCVTLLEQGNSDAIFAGDVADASSCPATEVVVTRPQAPIAPAGLSGLRSSISATILVTVNPDGTVKAVSVERSSGYLPVDNAALKAARLSTYSPKRVNCQAVEGTYHFTVNFEPN